MNARKLPIAGVAVALGLTVAGRAPGRVSPCPACNRGPGSDGRPVVGIARDGRAWRCHACGVGGDALDLVCVRVGGAPWGDLAADVRDEARARAAELGLCDPDPRADPATVRPVRALPAVAVAPPAVALDPDEVASWWARCDPATDPDVSAWLRARGLAAVLDRPDVGELVRALPVDEAPLPRWARLPVASVAGALEWNELDLLATVRTFGPDGRARGVRARWTGRVGEHPRADAPKEAGAAGAAASGLLLADPVALDVLAGRAAPDVVLVVEGCPDWLAACGAYPAAAVLGVPGSGAWSPAWGPALARGAPAARYVVATHADEAGDRYADAIGSALEAARLDVCRWRPPAGLDLADLARRGALPSLATLTRRPGALVDAPTSAPVPEPAPGPRGPSGAPMRDYEGPPDPPLDVYAPGPVATKGPTPTKADPSPGKNPLEAAWAPFTPGPWPPPPRRVLVAGLDLPMGRVGLLAGQGGVGKSWLSIQLAVCLALADTEWAHPWCGVPTWTVPGDEAGPSLVVLAEEDRDEAVRRVMLAAWLAVQKKGADGRPDLPVHRTANLPPGLLDVLARRVVLVPLATAGNVSLMQAQLGATYGQPVDYTPTSTHDALKARIGAGHNGERWRLVVLDPLAQLGCPNENDAAPASAFMRHAAGLLGSVAEGERPFCMVVHHANKVDADGSAGVRGSSAFVDAARWVGRLVRVKPHENQHAPNGFKTARAFTTSKANYGRGDSGAWLVPCDFAEGAFWYPGPDVCNQLTACEKAPPKKKDPPPPKNPAPPKRRKNDVT